MIASNEKHYDDEILQQLLDDRLGDKRSTVLQTHLSKCPRCRAALEQLAGNDRWWSETVEVLVDSQAATTTTHDSSLPRVDWLAPILEQRGDGLGMLDRYPVTSLIGQGGMGVVLCAMDEELNRPVAIKVLSPHLAGVGAARARFMREAQAAAAIVHPSIVPIYSVVTSARLPYLVMPLVSGGNLQQRIDREGPLELSEVLRIGTQVADGLAAAHRLGVIHRDIKPANLLVEQGNGRVLISDFGLARVLDDASMTCSGMIAGTPQYMSPEQARGETLDARSDLFSLGSLLYALSTGRPPFRADNPLAVLKKITETAPRPIHHVNERMPEWMNRLVSKLMTIRADDRIPSAAEASELLREAHAHVLNPSSVKLPGSLAKHPPSRLRRMVTAGSIVAMIVAPTIWMALHDNPSPAPANWKLSQTELVVESKGTALATIAPTPTPTPAPMLPNELSQVLIELDRDLMKLESELGISKLTSNLSIPVPTNSVQGKTQ